MVKIYNSLNTKLVVSFVVLVIAISGMSFLYTYGETKKALLDSTQDTLKEISGTMASEIDATTIMNIQPGDENTTQYQELISQLRLMRNMSSMVTNCYIFAVNGTALTFIADDADDRPAEIAESYTSPDLDKIVGAQVEPTVSDQIYSDSWGSFLSGYAPIKDGSGNTVGVLGVDMNADAVIDRQNFIGNTIYIIMAVGVLFAAVIVGLLSLTIIRDIKKLNQAAEKISKGDMTAEVNMKRKDEIGELGDSFSRMIASLKFEMLMRQEDEAALKEAEAADKEQK